MFPNLLICRVRQQNSGGGASLTGEGGKSKRLLPLAPTRTVNKLINPEKNGTVFRPPYSIVGEPYSIVGEPYSCKVEPELSVWR